MKELIIYDSTGKELHRIEKPMASELPIKTLKIKNERYEVGNIVHDYDTKTVKVYCNIR